VCFSLCFFKLELLEKGRSQIGHKKGFSPNAKQMHIADYSTSFIDNTTRTVTVGGNDKRLRYFKSITNTASFMFLFVVNLIIKYPLQWQVLSCVLSAVNFK
jgi:hypothetical protein